MSNTKALTPVTPVYYKANYLLSRKPRTETLNPVATSESHSSDVNSQREHRRRLNNQGLFEAKVSEVDTTQYQDCFNNRVLTGGLVV